MHILSNDGRAGKLNGVVFQSIFGFKLSSIEFFFLFEKSLYPWSKLSAFELPRLERVIEFSQSAFHFLCLSLDKLQPVILTLTVLSQVFIRQSNQIFKVFLSQNIPLHSVNDEFLYSVLREQRSCAQTASSLPGIPTHIVEKLPGFHRMAYHGSITVLAT